MLPKEIPIFDSAIMHGFWLQESKPDSAPFDLESFSPPLHLLFSLSLSNLAKIVTRMIEDCGRRDFDLAEVFRPLAKFVE